jgi:adenylate cyclase class IV
MVKINPFIANMENTRRTKMNFKRSEITKIEKLVAEKLISSTSRQKSIRADIRKIGFTWEDFVPKRKKPYNVENFRALIKELAESGQITIIED